MQKCHFCGKVMFEWLLSDSINWDFAIVRPITATLSIVANQWNGFYIIATSVMKELSSSYSILVGIIICNLFRTFQRARILFLKPKGARDKLKTEVFMSKVTN